MLLPKDALRLALLSSDLQLHCRRVSMGNMAAAKVSIRPSKRLISIGIVLALLGVAAFAQPAASAEDWITALPREPIHVDLWPAGKKVAVCFVLYVEVWGYG